MSESEIALSALESRSKGMAA